LPKLTHQMKRPRALPPAVLARKPPNQLWSVSPGGAHRRTSQAGGLVINFNGFLFWGSSTEAGDLQRERKKKGSATGKPQRRDATNLRSQLRDTHMRQSPNQFDFARHYSYGHERSGNSVMRQGQAPCGIGASRLRQNPDRSRPYARRGPRLSPSARGPCHQHSHIAGFDARSECRLGSQLVHRTRQIQRPTA